MPSRLVPTHLLYTSSRAAVSGLSVESPLVVEDLRRFGVSAPTSLCACGAGPAGGDPVEAAGQGKGQSGPPSGCCLPGSPAAVLVTIGSIQGPQGLSCGWEPPEWRWRPSSAGAIQPSGRHHPQPRPSGPSVQFSLSVVSNSLGPHGLQHSGPSYPSPTPGPCPNSCPLSQWCHPTISSSVVPFPSHLQSFPASGSSAALYPWYPPPGHHQRSDQECVAVVQSWTCLLCGSLGLGLS